MLAFDDLKECMAAGLERETIFCFVQGKFLQYVSGKTQQGQRCLESVRSCTNGSRYYESCCLYSAVYFAIERKVSDP